jgi:NADPH:quinone reductase-like Zn-dependent oxidoreductase
MTPSLSPSRFPSMVDICAGLGHGGQGTLRQSASFPATALLHAPESLSYEEASTLTCSGLTAYNALFGLKGREVKKDDWVLVQGSGGVSVAALQFAVAVGACVVATTSSTAKAERLKALGAKEVINYRETPTWGPVAKDRTPEGRGFDFVIDVGGDATLGQSLVAVKIEGVVVVAGMVGGKAEGSVPLMSVLGAVCTVRGVVLGTKDMFEEMCRFIDERGVKPAIDEKVFGFEDAKEALKFLESQEHFSKVVVRLR